MGPLTIRSRDGKEPRASSVSPILDSRTLARHQNRPDRAATAKGKANIHPISLCMCCHRAPTKIGVSAGVAPDLPDTSSPPPLGSHCRLSLTRYCSSQHQQLQLRYHMQAPFDQARLSGINKADWDRTTHHRPVCCPDRPDLVGEVVHSHCRSFSSRSRCRSS